MKYLYRTYQLLIALPLIAIYTLITSLMVIIGCTLGNGHFWGYYPGKWWAQFIIRILLLPVKVEGRENLVKGQSYVFVANHQGAFDIFLIYGFLSRNFKWMMKRQLRQMPFVGKACESAHHIFVDKRGASKIRETYDRARQTLQGGMSLVVFPEGARSFTGHMGVFKRGAFMLADDIELPVVPLTINGSFDIMPRTRDMKWVVWHPLRLTIHKPIQPVGKGTDNIKYLEEESYKVVMGGLEEKYQGFVENPDQ
ncbi:lysophospholipid acyltransferase family protein [Leyella stercorea]|uniref:lysophospholipid acyltransferase family protein n=1 Tax=Leyella stercorea TaxID=363265 RepID=UPI00242DF91F|nr:lysophospholipid acyltransferase family protein [Leyella stercorea]